MKSRLLTFLRVMSGYTYSKALSCGVLVRVRWYSVFAWLPGSIWVFLGLFLGVSWGGVVVEVLCFTCAVCVSSFFSGGGPVLWGFASDLKERGGCVWVLEGVGWV